METELNRPDEWTNPNQDRNKARIHEAGRKALRRVPPEATPLPNQQAGDLPPATVLQAILETNLLPVQGVLLPPENPAVPVPAVGVNPTREGDTLTLL